MKIAVLPHLAYGPNWAEVNLDAEVAQAVMNQFNETLYFQKCKAVGWQNLLYINTLVEHQIEGDCFGVSW